MYSLVYLRYILFTSKQILNIIVIMNNYYQRQASSLSKKKSSKVSNSPHPRLSTNKQKIKTQNSPQHSISKEQIRNTIKKIVYNHANLSYASKGNKNNFQLKEKQENRKSRKIRSRLQISIPNIETSLTPKNTSHHHIKYNDRQVQSTKASQNKMFNTAGRYDLKQQLVQAKRNLQRLSSEEQKNNRQSMKERSPTTKIRKNREEQTKKLIQGREDQCDPKAVLSSQQFEKFGDRFPQKFKRLALLGRGGFSVVWLGAHKSTKRKFAVKQILTKNPHQTHLKQIWFGSYFFEKGGEPRQQFENHIGINNICKLYSYEIRNEDSWLYYEICQESLGSSLFDLKGQTVNGQRIYKIQYKELIYRMREDINELKYLIIEVAKALHLINSHNIVHSDLKTENILIKVRKSSSQTSPYIKDLKIIDFGSSFLFTNLKQFSMATPQYMPPQILNYILFQNKLEYDVVMLNKMEKYKNPWVIDVWSLGCIVLEIITGVPLWMSLPTKINGTNKKAYGLFAIKGRLFNKIIAKQIQVVEKLNQYLITDNHSGIKADKQLIVVLSRMLSLNPDQRISPLQILNYFGIACLPEKIPSY